VPIKSRTTTAFVGSRRLLHLLIFAGKLLVMNLLLDDRRRLCRGCRLRRFLESRRTCVHILATQMSVVEISRSFRPKHRCELRTTSLETSLGRITRIYLVIRLATRDITPPCFVYFEEEAAPVS
jgi:hypothetical protein